MLDDLIREHQETLDKITKRRGELLEQSQSVYGNTEREHLYRRINTLGKQELELMDKINAMKASSEGKTRF